MRWYDGEARRQLGMVHRQMKGRPKTSYRENKSKRKTKHRPGDGKTVREQEKWKREGKTTVGTAWPNAEIRTLAHVIFAHAWKPRATLTTGANANIHLLDQGLYGPLTGFLRVNLEHLLRLDPSVGPTTIELYPLDNWLGRTGVK